MLEKNFSASNLASETASNDDYTELLRQMQTSLMESENDFEDDDATVFDAPMPTLLTDETDAPALKVSPQVDVSPEIISTENAMNNDWAMPEFPAFEQFANEFQDATKDLREEEESSAFDSSNDSKPADFTKNIETLWVETSDAPREVSSDASQNEFVADDLSSENPVEESAKAESDENQIGFELKSDVETMSVGESNETESASGEIEFPETLDYDFDEMPEMPQFLTAQNFESGEIHEKAEAAETLNTVESEEPTQYFDNFYESFEPFSPQIEQPEMENPLVAVENVETENVENLASPEHLFAANNVSTLGKVEESVIESNVAVAESTENSDAAQKFDAQNLDEQPFESNSQSLANVFDDVQQADDSAIVSSEEKTENLTEAYFKDYEPENALLEVAQSDDSTALIANESSEVIAKEAVSHFDEIENLVGDAQPIDDESSNEKVAPNSPRSDLAQFSFADEETLMSFLDNLDRNSFVAGSDSVETVAPIANAAAPVSVSLEEKHVVFKLDDNLFAFSASNIVEIAHPLKVTPLPFVPSWLTGVTNLRGDVLAVVDLRRLWNKQPITSGANKTKMLVLRSHRENLMMGLIVDSVREMCVLPDEFASVSLGQAESVNSFCGGYLQGAKHFDNNPVWILDAENFLSMAQEKADC